MATYIDVLKKIRRMRTLPVGWDYGRGGPAGDKAALNAFSAMFMLSRLDVADFDVVPGSSNGIILLGYRGDQSVEINVRSDGAFDFVIEDAAGNGDPVVGVTLVEIVAKLEEAGWRSRRLFVSCIQPGISRGSDDILASRSPMPLTGVVYLSSTPGAWPQVETKSARTYGSFTTRKSPDSHQSSGEYRQYTSRLALA